MKKIIALLILLVTGMVASAQVQQAPIHKVQSFFRVPSTYVCISNNQTLLYNSTTNTLFVPLAIGTNVYAGATNSVAGIGTFYPKVLGDVEVRSDANGNNPSACITVAWGVVTNYVGNAASGAIASFGDLGGTGMQNWPVYPGFTNSAGGPGVPTSVFAADVAATNTLTIVIQRSADGFNFGTSAVDKLQFQVSEAASTITAGGLSVVTTNLTSGFLQGAKKLRCLSIGTGNTSGSPGITLNALNYDQWFP